MVVIVYGFFNNGFCVFLFCFGVCVDSGNDYYWFVDCYVNKVSII